MVVRDRCDPVVSGIVHSKERTAAAGERVAFMVLSKVAALMGRQVKAVVDNLVIVQRRNFGRFEQDDCLDVVWVHSLDKQPDRWPLPGWSDVTACR